MWENSFFEAIVTSSIFAALFLGLLVYQLRDSRAREAKYQETIERLGKTLDNINEVKVIVYEIKSIAEGLANGGEKPQPALKRERKQRGLKNAV